MLSSSAGPHSHQIPTLLAILVLLAGLLATIPATTLAATFLVTTLDDAGPGSLRQAVADANATPGTDTVTFGAGLSGAIILTGGQLTLSDGVDIQGPGAAVLAVSGNNASRVFDVDAGVTATISGLTITGGAAAFGGGIENMGTLTVTNSTLSGNTASFGGGIFNDPSGTLSVTSSTFSGNMATNFGGGINNGGSATLAGTLLADNTPLNCTGSIISLGYNLSDDITCTLNQPTDLPNNQNANLDPNLADNGGPTETHALLSPSDAIDHVPFGAVGCGTNVTTDQRGFPRPSSDQCDIGAFEVQVNYFQACLYAGSLSQVSFNGTSTTTTVNCGRGIPILLEEGSYYHACLYAGSLSQFGTSEPTNCGRGEVIGLAAGDDLYGCLYAGSLSRLNVLGPSNCGRGVPVILEAQLVM